MRLIGTGDLERWASNKSAESRFPYFVKALVYAVIRPSMLRMPSGDAIWLPGYDGVVVNEDQNQFVPTGASVWELGTNSGITSKANDDFKKRSKDEKAGEKNSDQAELLDRSHETFVFATPRVWKDKDKWVAARKKENIWKDVRAIDGVDIQEWLEQSPSVSIQLATEMGISLETGLSDSDTAWEHWRYLTAPPTSEELVLAGREDQEKEFIGRLLASPSTFTIRGDSPREAWGFALAALRHLNLTEEHENLLARLIVVDNEDVANALRYVSNHILILKGTNGQVSGVLSSKGCHVVVPEGNDSHTRHNLINLARPTRRAFTVALEGMGISSEDAERYARACGQSITIFQRLHAQANFAPPGWSTSGDVNNLFPALLAGRWDETRSADRTALCQLAGVSDYSDVTAHLRYFLQTDDPPIRKFDSVWTLVAPVDAFQIVARYLDNVHLARFKAAFADVFSKVDPKIEAPPDQALYLSVEKETNCSYLLKSGMAETFLLIAERGKDARLDCISSPSDYCEELLRELPNLGNDWRIIASFRDQYPLLMEAAPNPLLNSLESLLEANPSDIRLLLTDQKGIFGPNTMSAGLLWGLEILAWNPEYLSRVALLLARLTALDPGGKMINRPIESLRDIFLWWYPGTNATITQRLEAIDLVLAREPESGWKLLAMLLPTSNSEIALPTARPRWRDFGSLPEDTLTPPAINQYLQAIIQRALAQVGVDPERWRVILEALKMFNRSLQEEAVNLLTLVAETSKIGSEKTKFSDILRDFIARHRTFTTEDWSLSTDLIDRFEQLLPHFTPEEAIERYRWLFEEWLPDLPSGEDDIKRKEEQVEALRQKAIQVIRREDGDAGVVQLGITCQYPGFVAFAAVPTLDDAKAVSSLVDKAVSVGDRGVLLASFISERALQTYGDVWREIVHLESEMGHWPPHIVASLLARWPNEKATWNEVAALGAAEEYWLQNPIRFIGGSSDDRSYQIDQLISAGRPLAALECVAYDSKEVPTKSLLKLLDAALMALARMRRTEELSQTRISSRDFQMLIDEFRVRDDISREELARREYQILPLLGSLLPSNLVLYEYLAEDAHFFVEVLCSVYRPNAQNELEDDQPTKEDQLRATMGYRLLSGMKKIPGLSTVNQIDESVLLEWINDTRRLASEADRKEVADLQIGGILANSPIDPEDGGWPHRAVRNAIDDLASDEIDRGLMIERHNMRGVYSKALYEGGKQERELADQYQGWADIARGRWPRTAQVLDMITHDWRDFASREDMRAEQDKLL